MIDHWRVPMGHFPAALFLGIITQSASERPRKKDSFALCQDVGMAVLGVFNTTGVDVWAGCHLSPLLIHNDTDERSGRHAI